MSTRARPTLRPALPLTAALACGVLLAGCAGAPAAEDRAAAGDPDLFPVEVTACGFTTTLEAPPEAAVTLNQGATEVLLALGLEDRMAGTAYLDDQVADAHAAAYDEVPVLAATYPSREELLGASPDFVYASYVSAFGDEVAGSQDELAEGGVASYLSPFGCPDASDVAATSWDSVWSEVEAVGDVFGVPERAAELRATQEQTLTDLEAAAVGAGTRVFWFDSGEDAALAGAGDGGPQLVVEATGAENVFADVEGNWSEVPWEDVVAADPDVIALADASWSSAEEKIAFLEADPVLSELRAVREGAYVTVPYSASTPGVRLAEGAATLAEGLEALGAQG
ncbi:ABC transporter substrate-binding protein [Nocardioides zeae]|uniref:ABC transporter substrate-binding protein n=1 Tax=Nocardioides imazamoxiresistens TaxID=3231893 RepID=A0ABU3PYL7_9ACTN|nr:ABC transporter substrate-binding protein [Nocardioides zeae]MDT9594271.1 ABC transporter substrate-binding protein [Nocardioides zeae]